MVLREESGEKSPHLLGNIERGKSKKKSEKKPGCVRFRTINTRANPMAGCFHAFWLGGAA
jgi:hypothetical protein